MGHGGSFHFLCRCDNVDKGTLLPTHRSRFLYDNDLCKGVVRVGPRRVDGCRLRFQGPHFRFEAFDAGHYIRVACFVSFYDGRIRHFDRWGLTVGVLRFAHDVEGVVACVARVNDSRRDIAGNVGRRVNVQISR